MPVAAVACGSRPGEPPKYDKPGVEADEGASDVPEDNPPPPPSTSEGLPELPPEPEKTP